MIKKKKKKKKCQSINHFTIKIFKLAPGILKPKKKTKTFM